MEYVPIILKIMAAIPRTFEEAFPRTPEREPEQDDDNENRVADNDVVPEANNVVPEAGNVNHVSLQTIRDNIISPSTYRAYVSDLLQFLQWVHTNENQWLTPNGNERLTDIYVQQENENARQHRARKMEISQTYFGMHVLNPLYIWIELFHQNI